MGELVVSRGSCVMACGSEIPHVYTSCIHTFMLFQMPSRNSGFVCDLFLACTVTLKGLCQRCYVNILSVVHILLFILLFYQRLEILETGKTLQNDLTDKDILPLADKDQILLYKCQL